ncbi:hypothetical protein MNBD_BACTEROID01-87 [hydrothermal vent metagenome]|uniref:Uncharacterized protein n=1 Tax=hydrothermal vent metagenome TaxID=652676 RepID=A0A3B0U7E5_9ZZZZ
MAYSMADFYIIVIQYIAKHGCKITGSVMKDVIIINFPIFVL